MAVAKQTPTEHQLKAVFLERFTRFIHWPDNLSTSNKPYFTIGVLGDAALIKKLRKIYRKQRIKNKRVKVHFITTPKEINDNIDLLFIGESQQRILSDIIKVTYDKPILTVSDSPNFCQQGVIINFYQQKKRLRFEINEIAARQAKLKISYKLLKSAKVIKPLHQ